MIYPNRCRWIRGLVRRGIRVSENGHHTPTMLHCQPFEWKPLMLRGSKPTPRANCDPPSLEACTPKPFRFRPKDVQKGRPNLFGISLTDAGIRRGLRGGGCGGSAAGLGSTPQECLWSSGIMSGCADEKFRAQVLWLRCSQCCVFAWTCKQAWDYGFRVCPGPALGLLIASGFRWDCEAFGIEGCSVLSPRTPSRGSTMIRGFAAWSCRRNSTSRHLSRV